MYEDSQEYDAQIYESDSGEYYIYVRKHFGLIPNDIVRVSIKKFNE